MTARHIAARPRRTARVIRGRGTAVGGIEVHVDGCVHVRGRRNGRAVNGRVIVADSAPCIVMRYAQVAVGPRSSLVGGLVGHGVVRVACIGPRSLGLAVAGSAGERVAPGDRCIVASTVHRGKLCCRNIGGLARRMAVDRGTGAGVVVRGQGAHERISRIKVHVLRFVNVERLVRNSRLRGARRRCIIHSQFVALVAVILIHARASHVLGM